MLEIEQNRRTWDLWAKAHMAVYEARLCAIEAGHPVITPLEAELLAPFKDQRLLHLQCHLGLDLFALHRLGFAQLAGIDFSPVAIAGARQWRDRLEMPDIDFYCGDARSMAAGASPGFELILINYGSLCWIPRIADYVQDIARLLVPGGRLLIVEIHPLIYATDPAAGLITLRDDYLESAQAHCSAQSQTHAAAPTPECTTYEWNHGLAEIYFALTSAGLTVEHFAEHEATPWRSHAFMESADGLIWNLPRGFPRVPLTFSMIARSGSQDKSWQARREIEDGQREG
jgi:SAM-dependent methyltransferase